MAESGVAQTSALQVRVNASMPRGSLGYAAKNVFTIGLSYIDNPLVQGTLAHELTHCQDRRQLQNHRIPHYLAEGRALLVGRAYEKNWGKVRAATTVASATRFSSLRFRCERSERSAGENGKHQPDLGWRGGVYGMFFRRTTCKPNANCPTFNPAQLGWWWTWPGMTYEDAFKKGDRDISGGGQSEVHFLPQGQPWSSLAAEGPSGKIFDQSHRPPNETPPHVPCCPAAATAGRVPRRRDITGNAASNGDNQYGRPVCNL